MSRNARLAACLVLIGSGLARGGFDEAKRAEKSDYLAGITSMVVVGRVATYREARIPAGETAPAKMARFEALIDVDRVESGEGVSPGKRIVVGFWSRSSKAQLDTFPTPLSGCGDYQVPPQPGELARIYVNKLGEAGFVSDHPAAFFAIDPGPRRPFVGNPSPVRANSKAVWGIAALAFAGLALVPAVVLYHRLRPGMGGTAHP